jgi:hypothetical protein
VATQQVRKRQSSSPLSRHLAGLRADARFAAGGELFDETAVGDGARSGGGESGGETSGFVSGFALETAVRGGKGTEGEGDDGFASG